MAQMRRRQRRRRMNVEVAMGLSGMTNPVVLLAMTSRLLINDVVKNSAIFYKIPPINTHKQ